MKNKKRTIIIGLLIAYCLSFGPMFFFVAVTKGQVRGFPAESINTFLNYFYLPHLYVAYYFEPYCRYYMFCIFSRMGFRHSKEMFRLLFDPTQQNMFDEMHTDFRMRFWNYVNGPLFMPEVTVHPL